LCFRPVDVEDEGAEIGPPRVGYARLMNFKAMAQSAVSGPRKVAVERAAPPVSRRTPFSQDAVRTVAGAVFLALAIRTVIRSLRAGFRG
jgi:hypothetical protein